MRTLLRSKHLRRITGACLCDDWRPLRPRSFLRIRAVRDSSHCSLNRPHEPAGWRGMQGQPPRLSAKGKPSVPANFRAKPGLGDVQRALPSSTSLRLRVIDLTTAGVTNHPSRSGISQKTGQFRVKSSRMRPRCVILITIPGDSIHGHCGLALAS